MIHRPWKINISSVVLVEISNDRIDTSFSITGDNIWIVSIRYDISTMGIGKYITQVTSTTSFSRYIYPRYWGNVSWDWQQSQSLTAVSVIDSSLNHWQQSQSLTAVSIIDNSLNHWQQSQSLTAVSIIDSSLSHWQSWRWPSGKTSLTTDHRLNNNYVGSRPILASTNDVSGHLYIPTGQFVVLGFSKLCYFSN